MIIVLLVIAVIIVVMGISIHNKIIASYNSAQRAWADVIAQERQKNKILPELERIAEQYKIHESSVLNGITELRTALKGLSSESVDVAQLKEAQLKTRSLINNLYAVSENYPDLKASTIYANLMKEIAEQQDNIGAAIRIFNSNVADFNTGIEVFPNSIINNNFTKKQKLNVFSDSEAAQGFEYKPNF
ncbi:LemA family protein [Zophobihabitans entericus]|nr:LemA family protein [Zophobihabitans entericus]